MLLGAGQIASGCSVESILHLLVTVRNVLCSLIRDHCLASYPNVLFKAAILVQVASSECLVNILLPGRVPLCQTMFFTCLVQGCLKLAIPITFFLSVKHLRWCKFFLENIWFCDKVSTSKIFTIFKVEFLNMIS